MYEQSDYVTEYGQSDSVTEYGQSDSVTEEREDKHMLWPSHSLVLNIMSVTRFHAFAKNINCIYTLEISNILYCEFMADRRLLFLNS